ncbi:MAG: hypothetical protein E3J50_04880, partial [Dehalococcoidia bacterium]
MGDSFTLRIYRALYGRMLLTALGLEYDLGRRLMPKGQPPQFALLWWPVLDRLLRAIHHIRPLQAGGSGIICFDLRRYRGPTTILNDGSRVKTGDTIMELHLDNAWFKRRRKLNLRASQSP